MTWSSLSVTSRYVLLLVVFALLNSKQNLSTRFKNNMAMIAKGKNTPSSALGGLHIGSTFLAWQSAMQALRMDFVLHPAETELKSSIFTLLPDAQRRLKTLKVRPYLRSCDSADFVVGICCLSLALPRAHQIPHLRPSTEYAVCISIQGDVVAESRCCDGRGSS